MNDSKKIVNRIAVIGNHLPRKCGIATFTTDLHDALSSQYPDLYNIVIPINDKKEGYDYPDNARFEIDEKDIDSYQSAVDFIHINNIDVVCLQHEFGIFGGKSGMYILNVLRNLKVPVVTTFHTVLEAPTEEQKNIMCEIAERSERVVVMSEKGKNFLTGVYNIPESKIDFIHHGIPDVPFVDPNYYKDKFNVEGKKVLLTFGLLSEGKGIEYAIKALPQIIEKHPEVVYMIVGATHPNVISFEGEKYRESLIKLAEELGVARNIQFHNRFVDINELIEFIGCAEIYLTPYLNPFQITSGTLSYSLGAGKAVISTPYWHAKELLADGRGRLVPFKEHEAIAKEVVDLLDNEPVMHSMRKKAYEFGRDMIWPVVAEQYMQSFKKARMKCSPYGKDTLGVIVKYHEGGELPPVKLDHMLRMTDNTGMIQHAKFTVPNYKEGYTTDDNARALIATVYLNELGEEYVPYSYNLAIRYLAFLHYAWNEEKNRFRNFMSFERRWLEEKGSQDSHGRSIWALGTVLGRSNDEELVKLSGKLFEHALPGVLSFSAPRAYAYTILGINEYLRKYSGDRSVKKIRLELTGRLINSYKIHASDDWKWFENSLTYDNAKLSHALLMSGQWVGNDEMTEIGLTSLRWLAGIQTSQAGNFVPIGNNGFYVKGKVRAAFDQQPIEAQAMCSACLEAYRITGDKYWHDEAARAFGWFLGRNDLNLALYDSQTGGCYDGLHPDRVNENQGAESTLAFLMALLEMQISDNRFFLLNNEKKVQEILNFS